MEIQYQETFQRENQQYLGSLSLCAVMIIMMNYWIFFHMVRRSDFRNLPIIRFQSYLSISLCTAWLIYTIIAFVYLKKRQQQSGK
jgi:hypothetical protein